MSNYDEGSIPIQKLNSYIVRQQDFDIYFVADYDDNIINHHTTEESAQTQIDVIYALYGRLLKIVKLSEMIAEQY